MSVGYRRLLLLPALSSCLLAACGPGRSRPVAPMPGDLSEELASAASPPGSIRDFTMVRAGERRRGVALIAPVKLSVPVNETHGLFEFRCFAAAVYNVGDGVTLEILWEDSSGARRLIERRFDAARRREDRRWAEISVPLKIEGRGHIVFAASAGASGDLVADWVTVAQPRVSPRDRIR